MKALKYILLTVGILGLLATIYNSLEDRSFLDNLFGFVSCSYLIWAGFNLKRLNRCVPSVNK